MHSELMADLREINDKVEEAYAGGGGSSSMCKSCGNCLYSPLEQWYPQDWTSELVIQWLLAKIPNQQKKGKASHS